MPYLRITCPDVMREQRHRIAQLLTDAVNELFFNPNSPVTRQELRERTTVHFAPYGDGDLFIGGRTPSERGRTDITVELSDWSMSLRSQKKIARALTPVVAGAFSVPPDHLDGINIRFHSDPPTDFSVGGRLISEFVPFPARLMKRIFG